MDAMMIELFGSGWTNLLALGVEDESTGAILGMLFGLFNTAVSVVTVGILFLVGATAIGDTAQTGKVMGGQGSMWVPIRAVIAAALLVPIVKGFSLLQVLLLSLVVSVSVTLANQMAVESAKFIALGNGTFTDPVAVQVDGVAEQVLYTSVCEHYYNKIEYDEFQGGGGSIQARLDEEDNNGIFSQRWSFDGDQYSGQGEAACGAYIVTCLDAEEDTLSMCRQQMASLQVLKAELDAVAMRIIRNEDADSLDVAKASIRYEQRNQQIVRDRVAKLNAQAQDAEQRSALVADIEQRGFAFLGQWYMTLASLNQRNLKYTAPTLDTLAIDQSKAIEQQIGIMSYLKRAESLLRLKNVALARTSGALSTVQKEQREIAGVLTNEGSLGDWLSRQSIVQFEGAGIESSQLFDLESDPLSGLQRLGATMVTLTTDYWSQGRIDGVVGSSNQTPDRVETLIGNIESRVRSEQQHSGANGEIETFARYIMILLFLSGLTLMYYIPAIPFILWTFGVIGYLILVLESLIAAPLWAASHALPSGRGLASDASRQGYSLVLNLAIRPPVMVMGLIGGGALMLVATKFAMTTFDIYSASLLKSQMSLTALLTFVALFVVEVVVLIALIHRCFALVHEASDRVVEWVTGHARPSNVAADEGRVSGSVTGAQKSGEAALGRASYAAGSASQTDSRPDPADNQRFGR
ncbi:MAG: DotA/TraY family protein [Pseudomonadota bacterium]